MPIKEEKKKVPTYEKYTIFNALLEAMHERQRKKSKLTRFLNRLRLRS
jgi:hypothetical protein